ncbi:MAG: metallophosphoesterase [Patescibacteria group bacterium]
MTARRTAWLLAGVLGLSLTGACIYSRFSSSGGESHFSGGPMLQRGDADGKTEIYVVWRTSDESDSVVSYRCMDGDAWLTVSDPKPTRYHAVKLSGLSPEKDYEYKAESGGEEIGGGRISTLDSGGSFRFAVFGDSGSGSDNQYAVAKEIETRNADFILHTGDLIYPRGEDKDYPKQFFAPYKHSIANAVFYPAIGNHDFSGDGGSPWLKNFVLPGKEIYYHFDYGNADFIALDSNNVSDESVKWLDEELAKCDKLWKIVFFRHPPFSNAAGRNGPRGGNNAVRDRWLPVMKKYRVDLVFCGHDHLYTRFHQADSEAINPTVIIEGCGGKSLYKTIANDEVQVTDNENYGFGLVDVQGENLYFRHITADGKELDYFSINKEAK